jgi:multimeric flavodoxin WrbA
MKVMAFNGSPRKKWNTATLLEKALEGAASRGAETELIHLYDLNFKGCRSCFACKTIGSKSYGRCAARDDLKSFLERLMFPYMTYTDPPQSLFPKKMKTALIYTMNVTPEGMKAIGLDRHVAVNERVLKMLFGASESLFSFDTYQFKDYSKVVAGRFDPAKKARIREEVFPQDCAKAFDLGVRLVQKTEV